PPLHVALPICRRRLPGRSVPSAVLGPAGHVHPGVGHRRRLVPLVVRRRLRTGDPHRTSRSGRLERRRAGVRAHRRRRADGAPGDVGGVAHPEPGPPAALTGGLVGSLGWDITQHWEPTLPRRAASESDVPTVSLCLVGDLAAIDHHTGDVWLIANAINTDDTDQRVDEAHADAVARLDAMQSALTAPTRSRPLTQGDGAEPELSFRTSHEEFTAGVLTAKQAIRDGEVFQVVLSQRLDLDCPADPLEVYRVLRTINP